MYDNKRKATWRKLKEKDQKLQHFKVMLAIKKKELAAKKKTKRYLYKTSRAERQHNAAANLVRESQELPF